MTSQEIIELIASIAEVNAESLEGKTSLEEIEWDSLMDLSFIAAVDKHTGKTISTQGLAAAKTVADLQALLAD